MNGKMPIWMLIPSMLFLYGGIQLCNMNLRWMSEGIEVEGKVIEHDVLKRPVVEFMTREGARRTITGSDSGAGVPPVGEKVNIRYKADNPGSAEFTPGFSAWGMALAFLSIGLGFPWIIFRQRVRK